MSATTPAAGVAAPTESSIDRALALALAGEREQALRLAAGILDRDPSSPTVLVTIARLLGELGWSDAARHAATMGVNRAVNRSKLPLAVATAHELTRFGGDARSAFDWIAAAFCKGSPRLGLWPAPPPPMPPADVAPLPDVLAGQALLDQVGAILRRAEGRLLALDRSSPPLARLPLFSSMSASALRALCAATSPSWLPAGTAVIEQGGLGEDACFVARGELEVKRTAKDGAVVLARLASGALFGEMALLARAPRAATVTTTRPSIIVRVDRGALDALADEQPEVGVELAAHCRDRMIDNLGRTSPVLRVVPPADRSALLERFQTRIIEARGRLITQDEPTPGLYFIASGEVAVVRRDPDARDKDPLVVATLGPGDVVGEVALVLRRRASADVVAIQPTVTLFLQGSEFLGLVHDHPAMLAELYLLAVKRDQETTSILEADVMAAEDFVLA
jgi:CRP-like cAMP-binding protein